jgi:hypothetical protein
MSSTLRVTEILDGDWNTVHWPAVPARTDFGLGRTSHGHRLIGSHGRVALETAVDGRYALE